MSDIKKHQLVIIGAGPGGYRAAFMAADLGLPVTLIDPEINPGGVCLYRGCIPTKALLHLSKIKNIAAKASEMGILFPTPEVDVDKVRKWKEKVVKKLTDGLGQLVKAHKINYMRGKAKFLDSNTLEVDDGDKSREIKFEKAVIATGASPLALPGLELDDPRIMDSDASLELKDIPGTMLVVGGGYIGMETATIYRALNTVVSVAEMIGEIMPGMDEDLVATYKKANEESFKEFFLETKVTGIEKKGDKMKVNFQEKDGKTFSRQYDKILVAIGQKPNVDNLGLENTAVECNEKGFVKVNELQQTSEQHIFAIGDVTGPPLLAHKASYEGRIAAEVIAGKKAANDAKAIPTVIYTDPEIAMCGLSEKTAKEKNIKVKVVRFPWTASGSAVAMNAETGFTKLLVHPESERILGAGIVGKNAGDMIAEMALAIEMAATAADVAMTIHPHPSVSETILETAEMFYGHPAHTKMKK